MTLSSDNKIYATCDNRAFDGQAMEKHEMDIGATTPRPGFAGNSIVRNALFLAERMVSRIRQTEIPLKVMVDSSLSGQAWLVSYFFFGRRLLDGRR